MRLTVPAEVVAIVEEAKREARARRVLLIQEIERHNAIARQFWTNEKNRQLMLAERYADKGLKNFGRF
ncbi:MAG: hypothetical protein KL801_12580 [Mesorhizobium sp.]|nr:hypothetical protein [Mesorhizobium sp.]